MHQIFDPAGRDRVERRARFVHQQHVRVGRQRAGDAEPLLLAAGHPESVVLEAVLDVVPKRSAAQRLLNNLIHRTLHPEDLRAEGDVVVDRLGEWVRLLKDHPNPLANLNRIDLVAV